MKHMLLFDAIGLLVVCAVFIVFLFWSGDAGLSLMPAITIGLIVAGGFMTIDRRLGALEKANETRDTSRTATSEDDDA